MIVNSKVFFFVASVAVAVACQAAEPYERYQTIIDRKPFGPEPVNFDPEAAPGSAAANAAGSESGEMTAEQRTAEEQQVAASVRVSMINVTPAGAVAVGFTDSSAQPPENYYLIVGRSQNGWTVKNADPGTESVTLEKGGIEVTVKLGESSGGGSKGVKEHQAGRMKAMLAKSDKPSDAAQAGKASPRIGGLARLRQRREKQRAEARAAEAKKAEAAAVAAAEREEREAREAEEKQARAEQEAREAEERAQQREALRQIQEQLRRDREARASEQQQSEEGQEE